IELIIPDEIPDLTVDVSQALSLAYENNPEILGLERQLIEAERDVAVARGEKGLNANLTARFGYSGSGATAPDAYTDFDNTQMVNLQFSMPIMDWGLGRGKYKMAQSNQEVVRTNVMQDRIDFDQSVFLTISQFNFQDDQLSIAAKSDTIASRRYEVTKQRFLIGKIDVLELNVADSEKDVAKRNFITALRNYWTDFYNVRRLTLYDFIKNEALTADFDSLVD
ncbi:MAG: TolC family protein, partial [Bacteroidota bacterium]|nr:TolC family protein [Bacteroidota bacterium]